MKETWHNIWVTKGNGKGTYKVSIAQIQRLKPWNHLGPTQTEVQVLWEMHNRKCILAFHFPPTFPKLSVSNLELKSLYTYTHIYHCKGIRSSIRLRTTTSSGGADGHILTFHFKSKILLLSILLSSLKYGSISALTLKILSQLNPDLATASLNTSC